MSNWKRVVAREWLTFLACLVLILCFGLVATVAGADMDDKAWEAVLASGVWLWIFAGSAPVNSGRIPAGGCFLDVDMLHR
jgi:hypothetical protein